MTKIRHKSRYIWFVAACVWMALIFHFSNQKAIESSEISGGITYRAAGSINKIFHLAWDEETLTEIAQLLEYPVRKAAHMTEYAVLAWIFFENCLQYPLLRRKSYVWAWGGAVVYAATDEFHQLFVEGRSGQWKDVAIDGTGAFFGLLAVWITISIYEKFKKERGEVNG